MAPYSSNSNFTWESESVILLQQQRPRIESRIDIRCYQDFLNKRKRKLLEKLIETRATYENVKNQILSNINSTDDKNMMSNPEKHSKDDVGNGKTIVQQIVDLIDTGNVGPIKSIMSVEKSIVHQRNSSRETCNGTSSNSEINKCESTVENYKQKRVVNSKAKRIRYGPSSCVLSASTLKPVDENNHAKDLISNDLTAKYSVSILNRYIYMNYEDSIVTRLFGSTTYLNESNDSKFGTNVENNVDNKFTAHRKKRSHEKFNTISNTTLNYYNMPHQIITRSNLDTSSEYSSRHRLRNEENKVLTSSLRKTSCDLQYSRHKIEKTQSELKLTNELINRSSEEFHNKELSNRTSIEFSTKDLNMHIMCMLKLKTQNKHPNEVINSISSNSILSKKISDLIKQVQSKSLYDMFLNAKCVKMRTCVKSAQQSVSKLSINAIGSKEVQANRIVQTLKQATVLAEPNYQNIASTAKLLELAKNNNINNLKTSRLDRNGNSILITNSKNKNTICGIVKQSKSNKVNSEKVVKRIVCEENYNILRPLKIHLNKSINSSLASSRCKLKDLYKIKTTRSGCVKKKNIESGTISAETSDTQHEDSCASQRTIVSLVRSNRYYSPAYNVCYNFLYGSNNAGLCDYRHHSKIKGQKKKYSKISKRHISIQKSSQSSNDCSATYFPKLNNRSGLLPIIKVSDNENRPVIHSSTFKTNSTHCNKFEEMRSQISSHLLNSSYYAFNLLNIANTPYKLKDYECEPGVCVPNECDPIECEKRIKRRLDKHKMVQSSQNFDNKSTGYPKLESHVKKNQSNFQNKSRCSKQGKNEKSAESKIISGKNVVRFGSKLNVNVEFYKENSSISDNKCQRPRHTPSVKSTISKERKKMHQCSYMQRKNHHRGSQVETHTVSKGTGDVGKILKRCFCTRQLKKQISTTKSTKNVYNAASQSSVSKKKHLHEDLKTNREGNSGDDSVTVGTKTIDKYKLDPGECEPGVCIPNECDPVECEKRIKRRLNKDKTVQSSPSSGNKSINTDFIKPAVNARKTQALLRTKSHASRPSKICRKSCPRRITECNDNPRKSYRFGSNISLNIDFFVEHPSANEVLPQQTMICAPCKKTLAPRETKLQHRDSTVKSASRHTKSQIEAQTASKSTGVSKFLQRCFCILKLQKQDNIKLAKRGANVGSQGSTTLTKRKRKESQNTSKKSCGEDCKSTGTITRHRYKVGAKHNLEPGECEPGVCVPNECDPIECDKRIKCRLNKDKMIQSSTGSDTKSITTDNITPVASAKKCQAAFQAKNHPSKVSRQNCPKKITECNNVLRKSYRFGSDISLNLEFFMEHPSANKELSRTDKTCAPCIQNAVHKQKNKIHRDSITENIGHNRESQIETQTASKGTGGVSKLLQRCFCTLSLKKQDTKRGKKVKSHFTATDKNHERRYSKKIKKDKCGEDCKTVGTKTKHKYKPEIRHKLEPGECEPGVCIPNECDPIQCDKRIKGRLNKDKIVQSSPGSDTKSITTDKLRPKASVKKNQAQFQTKRSPCRPSRQDRQSCSPKVTECNVPRKSYRFGSNVSLNLDFYVEHSSADEELPQTQTICPPCVKNTVHKQKKRIHRDSATENIGHNRESQVETQTASKGTGGVSKLLQRCFCTLSLRKQDKDMKQVTKRDTKVKSHNTTTERSYERRYSKKTKKYPCGKDCECKTVGTETKHKYKTEIRYKLDPGECEPGVCVPNQCDPYKCLERMKHRLRDSKTTSTDNPTKKSTFTCQTKSVPDAKCTSTECSEVHKIRPRKGTLTKRKSMFQGYNSAHPSKRSVHFGSKLSFGMDFYKENNAIGDQLPQALNTTRKSCDQFKCKQTKSHGSCTDRMNKQHSESQAFVDNEDKATGMGQMLKRCFCTLKLHKQPGKPNIKRQKPAKKMKSEGTKTSNKVRFQGPVISHKLEPYECEPNICVPSKCDPYECEKLIRRRNKQTKSASTDFEKNNKCSFCNTITSSKLNAKKIQSDVSKKSIKKRKNSESFESGTSVVKYGSSIRINVEFYKEKGYPQSYAELKKNYQPSEASSEMSQKKRGYQKRNIKMKNKAAEGLKCGTCNKKSQSTGPARKDTQSCAMPLLQRCFCTLKLKNKNAQLIKSDHPSEKDTKQIYNKECMNDMETIMPYSKKKFKKYASETKLHQRNGITPTSKKGLHNKISETILGSKTKTIGNFIRKCTCHLRDKYKSSRLKHKQGISLKIEPKGETNLDENPAMKTSLKPIKVHKPPMKPTNCENDHHEKNYDFEIYGHCEQIANEPIGSKVSKKKKKRKLKVENENYAKTKNKIDDNVQQKPIRKTKSLKAVKLDKPPVKPTRSERRPENKYDGADQCDHCGKQKRKQKSKYSRVAQREEDITLSKAEENIKSKIKKKSKKVKLNQNVNDDEQCEHCRIQLTSADKPKKQSKNNPESDKMKQYSHLRTPCKFCDAHLPSERAGQEDEPCVHCRNQLTSKSKSNTKRNDQNNRKYDGTPCSHCHPELAAKKQIKKSKTGKSTSLLTDTKQAINDFKNKFGNIFDNCSGSADTIAKKFTTMPAIRKIKDSLKCVSDVMKKDYSIIEEKVDSQMTDQTISPLKDAVLEFRIDQSGMCILNSDEIRQKLMEQAQAKFLSTQKETIDSKNAKSLKQQKKDEKRKKAKKLQTQKDEAKLIKSNKDHTCKICCECQQANRERYKNSMCRKKLINKQLVCCEEPGGGESKKPDPENPLFKPEFSVYVDSRSNNIINELDFRQNMAPEEETGCRICDAALQAKRDTKFPVPPVEIRIDKDSLSIINLPKVTRKMEQAMVKMEKLKEAEKKVKAALFCPCSSTCRKGMKVKVKPEKIVKKTGPCPCGDICKGPKPGAKLADTKKRDTKGKKDKAKTKGKDKGKAGKSKSIIKSTQKREKEQKIAKLRLKEERAKRAKIKKKMEVKRRSQVQAQYKKIDAKRRAARLKSDKRALKNIKKVDSDFQLVADSVVDMLTLGTLTMAGSARCAERELLDLKGTLEKVKKFKHNPQLAVKQMKTSFSDSPIQATCERLRFRCARMKCTQAIISKMEECACTNYLVHSCDKDPKKRLKFKKKKKKRERIPIDFECSLYMGQLRRKTWLWVYYMCPWFYPHWRAIVEGFKQFTDMLLFLLAVVFWSPCIAALEIFRTLICCVVCTR